MYLCGLYKETLLKQLHSTLTKLLSLHLQPTWIVNIFVT